MLFKMFIAGLLLSGSSAFAANPCASIANSNIELKNGVFAGCRLQSVAAGSLYAKLGLKPGDIVQPPDAAGPHSMEIKNTVTAVSAADGFRLTSVSKGSIYDKLGLKAGDVIVSMNGKKIRSAADAESIAETLKARPSKVRIEISRDGKLQTLTSSLSH